MLLQNEGGSILTNRKETDRQTHTQITKIPAGKQNSVKILGIYFHLCYTHSITVGIQV